MKDQADLVRDHGNDVGIPGGAGKFQRPHQACHRLLVLAGRSVGFAQALERICDVDRYTQLFPQLQGLLVIRKSVVVVPDGQIHVGDIVEALRLVSLIARLTLDL